MVPMMALKTWWGSCQPSGVFMSTHDLYTNLNWCPREVVGGNREGGRNEWCFWMILKKNRSCTVYNFSKRCDVMNPIGCHMHRIVSSTSSFLIWKSKKRIWPWLSWVPVITKKLSQNPQVMEPSRWRNLKNWFLRPSWGAKKPQVVKRNTDPTRGGILKWGCSFTSSSNHGFCCHIVWFCLVDNPNFFFRWTMTMGR